MIRRKDGSQCRSSNFCLWLNDYRWKWCTFINKRRCSGKIFRIFGLLFFYYPLQISSSFDQFQGVLCISFSFPLDKMINPRYSTIYSLLGKNHSVNNRIYFLFRLSTFFKLELLIDFFIYLFSSCNVSLKERYMELKMDLLFGRQLNLISLLSNFQYFKRPK